MAKMKTLTINGQQYIVMDEQAWEQIGDLDALATEDKENLVAAVNEVLASVVLAKLRRVAARYSTTTSTTPRS